MPRVVPRIIPGSERIHFVTEVASSAISHVADLLRDGFTLQHVRDSVISLVFLQFCEYLLTHSISRILFFGE